MQANTNKLSGAPKKTNKQNIINSIRQIPDYRSTNFNGINVQGIYSKEYNSYNSK